MVISLLFSLRGWLLVAAWVLFNKSNIELLIDTKPIDITLLLFIQEDHEQPSSRPKDGPWAEANYRKALNRYHCCLCLFHLVD